MVTVDFCAIVNRANDLGINGLCRIARKCDMSDSTILNLRKTSQCTIHTASKIAKGLELQCDDFVVAIDQTYEQNYGRTFVDVNHLCAALINIGFSYSDLAAAMHYSRQYIRIVVSKSRCSVDFGKHMAEILGCDLKYIMPNVGN